jgi:hypothetical protein
MGRAKANACRRGHFDFSTSTANRCEELAGGKKQQAQSNEAGRIHRNSDASHQLQRIKDHTGVLITPTSLVLE